MKLAVPLLATVALLACGEPRHPANCPASDHRCIVSVALDAVDVQTCRNNEGPYGKGHVRMLVTPKGEVTEVIIDGGGFAGTHEGECVAEKYRTFRAPRAEDGAANVAVGKSFELR